MIKKALNFLAVLIVSGLSASAGRPDAELLTECRFTKFLGGIILLQAQLDDYSDTLNFILDTGSGGISLDSTTCERLRVQNRLTDTLLSGVGGQRKVRFAFDRKLRLGGIVMEHFDFHVVDYSMMTHLDGRKIDGVIGYSFLKRYIVTIDYEQSVMRIYKPGAFLYPAGSYVFEPPLRKMPVPVQQATLTDRLTLTGDFYFDLGARMELVVTRRFAAEHKLLSEKRKPYFIGVEGIGGREQMQVSVVKSLRVGTFTFRDVPVYVFDDPNNVVRYPDQYGLIGSGIYSRFNLVVNLPEGEIAMKPNRYFGDPFDYAYSGLNIYDDEGRYRVYDVAKDSPAALAGIRNGDEIIKVDNQDFGNVQACRNALAHRNAFLVVQVKRGESYFFALMKTGSIL